MNVREQITQKIIDAMLKGPPPWRAGWTAAGMGVNAITGNAYRGVNQLLLGMQGHADPRWLTYKQAKKAGFQVRKGEKSTKIVRMVEVEPKKDDSGPESEVLAEEQGRRLVMRLFDVFNAEQIDGMPPLPAREHRIDASEGAEAIVSGLKQSGLKIHHGGAVASYTRNTDTINMPQKCDFHSTEDYWSTMLHECAHSTGAVHRLCRDMGSPGSNERAREELRAEIASAMLCAELGIPMGPHHIDSHAAYVLSWVSALKNDVNAIFEAAGMAQGICDYLRANTPAPEIRRPAETTPSSVAAPASPRKARSRQPQL